MYEDLKNKKIGKLEIIDIYRKNNRTFCKCKCECGNIKEIRLDSLKKMAIQNLVDVSKKKK